jgi:hypothetical protein
MNAATSVARTAGSRSARAEPSVGRARYVPDGVTGHRALPGLGDEAFAYQRRSGKRLSYLVVVRVSNVVAEVVYSGEVEDDPEGRLAAGGLRAARWVVDALSRQA